MSYSLQGVFEFLQQLKLNNNRNWFQNHKVKYEEALQNMISFADSLLVEMKKTDNIATVTGKKSLHRIYRDVRFSKNKQPYKNNWSGSLKRATNTLRGGYYFHLEPGNTFIAGGFFGPNPDDLKRIRKHIEQDDELLRGVLESDEVSKYFGMLEGAQVKTAPKGFPKDHPAIDLLRYKQYYLTQRFSDIQAFDKDFHKTMADGFYKLRPFFNIMSEFLTTDLNGISTI